MGSPTTEGIVLHQMAIVTETVERIEADAQATTSGSQDEGTRELFRQAFCESREVPPSPDEPGRGETRERPLDVIEAMASSRRDIDEVARKPKSQKVGGKRVKLAHDGGLRRS